MTSSTRRKRVKEKGSTYLKPIGAANVFYPLHATAIVKYELLDSKEHNVDGHIAQRVLIAKLVEIGQTEPVGRRCSLNLVRLD